MHHTVQANAAPGRTSRRAMGLLFAGLLQVGFVWALVTGLDVQDLAKQFVPPIDTFFVKDKVKPQTPPPVSPQVRLDEIVVPQPIIVVDDGTPRTGAPTDVGPAIHPTATSGPADHGPLTIANTHTIPPYPILDIRLGNQGTVLLRVLIGADGRILDAKVVRSSGSDSLDRAAQTWVMARWRYQPAVRGGVAVPSAVDVAVKFDLKNAG